MRGEGRGESDVHLMSLVSRGSNCAGGLDRVLVDVGHMLGKAEVIL